MWSLALSSNSYLAALYLQLSSCSLAPAIKLLSSSSYLAALQLQLYSSTLALSSYLAALQLQLSSCSLAPVIQLLSSSSYLAALQLQLSSCSLALIIEQLCCFLHLFTVALARTKCVSRNITRLLYSVLDLRILSVFLEKQKKVLSGFLLNCLNKGNIADICASHQTCNINIKLNTKREYYIISYAKLCCLKVFFSQRLIY